MKYCSKKIYFVIIDISNDHYGRCFKCRNKRIARRDPNLNKPQLNLFLETRLGNKPDVFLGIPVAAHQESPQQIIRTLELLNVQNYNHHKFRVFLLLNSPTSDYECRNFNNVRNAISEFAAANPTFPLSVYQRSFSKGTAIGKIRGTLWDKILHDEQSQPGVISKNKIGLNLDIDIVDISPEHIEAIRSRFDEDKSLDVHYSAGSWGISGALSSLVEKRFATDSGVPSVELHVASCLLETFIRLINTVDLILHFCGKINFEATGSFRLNKLDLIGGVDKQKNLAEMISSFDQIKKRSNRNSILPQDENSKPMFEDIINNVDIHGLTSDHIRYDYRRQLFAMARGNSPSSCWDINILEFSQTDDLRDPTVLLDRIHAVAKYILENISEHVYDFERRTVNEYVDMLKRFHSASDDREKIALLNGLERVISFSEYFLTEIALTLSFCGPSLMVESVEANQEIDQRIDEMIIRRLEAISEARKVDGYIVQEGDLLAKLMGINSCSTEAYTCETELVRIYQGL